MKKLFTILVALIAVSTEPIYAWDYECIKIDDLYYNLDTFTLIAEITYKSRDSETNTYNYGWNIATVTIPPLVNYRGQDYTVKSIGYGAFADCAGLMNVTISNSVTSIGGIAFRGCVGLSSIEIPNSVISIGGNAFEGCSGMTSITIPSSVTSIGSLAFNGCTSLTSVHITDIAAWCRNGIVDNPLRYAHHLYLNGSEIKDLVIPDGVTRIRTDAFWGCTELTSVTIPSSVTSIGSAAFYDCPNLTSVHITDIAAWCKINFSDNPLSYAHHLYLNGSEIKDLVIPDGVTSIEGSAFKGCTNLTSVFIPSSITSIGTNAFSGCTALPVVDNLRYADSYLVGAIDKTQSTYTIKEGTRFIGSFAFSGCTSLTSIPIPNSVTDIGEGAFWGCANLTSIEIPNSVTSIGNHTFINCSSLTSITCDAVTPPTCKDKENSFYTYDTTIPLYVPAASTDLYKVAEGWKEFENILPISCIVASGTCGENVIWVLNCDSVLTVEGIGTMYDYPNPGKRPWYSYINHIKSIIIDEGVSNIGQKAFTSCVNLTSVEIPESITQIGERAFSGCENLTSVTIPESITQIGERAFSGCENLTSVTIHSNFILNGNYGRYPTSSSLKDIFGKQVKTYTLGDAITSVSTYAFGSCDSLMSVSIPNSVSVWGDSLFYNCHSLTTVNIPASISKIGRATFYGCRSLPSIIIPNNVTEIGVEAFRNCRKAVYVQIGEKVESVDDDAFRSCSIVKTITIPSKVRHIGHRAFLWCDSLSQISVEVNNSNFCSIDGVLYDKDKRKLIQYPIGRNGDHSIPYSVDSIASYAFYGEPCYLSDLTCEAVIPPILGNQNESSVFNNYKIPLHVPASSIDLYKVAEGWKEFENILPIAAEETEVTETKVTPEATTAEISWPQVDNAYTYELVIKDKDGNIVCTLVFNAQGQLMSIAFNAPARGDAPQKMQTAGFAFTVTGLDSGKAYDYTLTAKNEGGTVLKVEEGSFTTKAPQGIDDVIDPSKATKIIRDGQVLIQKGEKVFDLRGQEVK